MWCAEYSRAIGRDLTPVGEYSHMTLMIDEDTGLGGGFDAEFGYLGATLEAVVSGILIGPVTSKLDRTIDG